MPPPPLHDNCSAFRSQPETYEKKSRIRRSDTGLPAAGLFRRTDPGGFHPRMVSDPAQTAADAAEYRISHRVGNPLPVHGHIRRTDLPFQRSAERLSDPSFLRSTVLEFQTLDIFVIYYLIKSYPVSKTASVLFAPYALWVLFATYLNGYIMLTN